MTRRLPFIKPMEGPRPGDSDTEDRRASLITHVLFAMTGIGVVLPGSLLPVLLSKWGISDAHAGYLFFTFFIASTSGALLARGSLPRSMARGCLLVAVGMGSLAVVSGTIAFVSIGVYGLGLGVTMTSVSLWHSRRYPRERTARMARLNLLWAIGACFGPFIVLRGSAKFGEGLLLVFIALMFAGLCLLSILLIPDIAAGPRPERQGLFRKSAVPVIFYLLVPLSTGIESGTGGWLATYTHRSGHGLELTITTVTCFWGGILMSRVAQSHRSIAAASTALILRLAPWLMIVGLLLLLDARNGLETLCGAFLLGAAVGPMYPLLVALFLNFGEAGNIVFVLGGVGAALLPWFTGLLSTHTQSLRVGFDVLFVAAIFLALLGSRSQYDVAPKSMS